MLKKIRDDVPAVLALEVVDGFTAEDEAQLEVWFDAARAAGADPVHFVILLEGASFMQSEWAVFFKKIGFLKRALPHMGRLAVVSDSAVVQKLVPVDGFFYRQLGGQGEERYFKTTELEAALTYAQHGA